MAYVPAPVSYAVRNAVLTRLQDAKFGYNAQLALIGTVAPYNFTSDELPTVNWATSLWMGDIDPESMEEEDLEYPYVVIAVHSENDEREAPYAMFSGSVELSIRLVITWDGENPLQDYETPVDIASNALLRCFPSQGTPAQGLWSPAGSSAQVSLINNFRMKVSRSPVRTAGDNRARDVTAAMSMLAVVQNGLGDYS